MCYGMGMDKSEGTIKITANFRNGDTAVRTTEAAYTHASRSGGKVRFHTSETAARKAAGSGGEIARTDYTAAAASTATATTTCAYCHEEDGRTIMGISGHPEVGKVHGRCVAKALGR